MSTNCDGSVRPAGRLRSPHLGGTIVLGLSGLLLGACEDSPAGPDPEPPVALVEVTPESLDLDVGEALDLQAVAYSAAGAPLSGRTITWSTEDAGVVGVTAAGRVTGVAPGVADVYAKAGGVTGVSTVRVLDPEAQAPVVTGLDPASVVAGGPGFELTVTGTGFAPGSRVLWGGGARPTTWLSAGELRVQILRTDVEDAGTAQVVVENPPFGGPASEPAIFTIAEPAGGSAVISALEPPAVPAGSLGFTLTVRGLGFREGATVLWDGSPRATTVVSPAELRAEIHPVDVWAEGAPEVTVVNPDTPGSAPKAFLVGPSGVATVAISPHELTVDPGDEGQLLARPLAADLSPIPGRHVAWSSTNRNVIDVFGDGSFRAVRPGTARIRAGTADRWSEIPVVVRDLPVGRVLVGPSVAGVLVGGQVRLQVAVFDTGGVPVQDRPVAWASDQPWVASVDDTGLVTAHSRGTARIRAEAGGVSGYATVEVRQWPTTGTWTFDLRWPDPSVVRPSVGDTTWVDDQGTSRTARMTLTGAVLVLDRAAGRYVQRLTLSVSGIASDVLRTEAGALGYDWGTGELAFTPDGRSEGAFTGHLSGPGEMRVSQAVGDAPRYTYLYVVR